MTCLFALLQEEFFSRRFSPLETIGNKGNIVITLLKYLLLDI